MEIKIPFYNIINIFLPGLVLIGSSVLLFIDEMGDLARAVTNLGNTGVEVLVTISLFAIAYEIGFILFRFGAVAFEPLLKRIFKWAEYSNYIAAGKTSKEAYEKLDMLSREYGYARTRIVLFSALSILAGIQMQWLVMVCCLICIGLFIWTVRGHMKRMQEAIAKYLETSDS